MGTTYTVGDRVPAAGRYRCANCGNEVGFSEDDADEGIMFSSCPSCRAGSDGGPLGPDDDVWESAD
ncbi:MAG: hypothetical protein HGA38_02765 [Candidatus Moranbacteria bacterium]|nr:hypothetical protein [Candidatus Moranbacteria bacterium]NTW46246.1 hypothetical protein [Candidatus Moranbacteria bacterium]